MVLVSERLEGGPVSSRVSTFPDVFSVAKGGPKCAEGGGKPWMGGGIKNKNLLVVTRLYLKRSIFNSC